MNRRERLFNNEADENRETDGLMYVHVLHGRFFHVFPRTQDGWAPRGLPTEIHTTTGRAENENYNDKFSFLHITRESRKNTHLSVPFTFQSHPSTIIISAYIRRGNKKKTAKPLRLLVQNDFFPWLPKAAFATAVLVLAVLVKNYTFCGKKTTKMFQHSSTTETNTKILTTFT